MTAPIPREFKPIRRICFDLDGTLATETWPSPTIGELIPAAAEMLVGFAGEGCEVVIYTARPVSHARRIWKWVEENGLAGCVYDVVCGKPQAAMYVDDRAWQPPWRTK